MEKQTTAGFWLSPQQKLVWSEQAGGHPLNASVLVSIEGVLDAKRLRESLSRIIGRHEILRTVYRSQPGMRVPFQVVLDTAEPIWEMRDLSAFPNAEQEHQLQNLLKAEREREFDLQNGPVLRACVIGLSSDRAALIVSLPALAGDLHSLNVLVNELAAIYGGNTNDLEAEPLRYVQFAQWQSDLLETVDENTEQAKAYWSEQNAKFGPVTLQHDYPGADAFRPESVSLAVQSSTVANIAALANNQNATMAEVLLSGWQCLLWRLTNQAAFATRVSFSGRAYEELETAVGLIAKFLPISGRFDADYRFQDVVEHVHAAVASAGEWQEHFTPGDGLDAGLPVAFEYADIPAENVSGDTRFNIRIETANSERFQLKLVANRKGQDLAVELHYDGSRFNRATIVRWGSHFQTLLAAAVHNPAIEVSRLPVLTPEERQLILVDWNNTAADYPRGKCYHELFEEQAARTPDRTAVRSGHESLTYSDLNIRANQLAHYLIGIGVQPNSLVGMCVDRSVDTIVALLGIIKAGAAYVPLNADNPKARLAQQLEGAAAVVTEEKLASLMPDFGGHLLCIDRDRKKWNDVPIANLNAGTTPEGLVYVIYTSGSTGIPKGVAVRHRNLVNYAYFITERLQLSGHPEGLNFATVSTVSADLGNTCIFPALMSGGCLHIISHDMATDAGKMAAYNQQHAIDVLKIVPSHLTALVETNEGRGVLPRKHLVTGGEALSARLLERIAELGAPCQVLNHYGPTETTIGSLTLRLNEYKGSSPTIPIGRPIANTQVYILDARLEPVPVGVAGELYIAGDGVTAGYLNQPERTSERFLDNPHGSGRMYRTGDLARYTSTGEVEFLGRGDDQVKIRGFRVELGEIEAILDKHPAVKQAVVLARADGRGDKRLVAYVVVRHDESINSEALRQYLKEHLPEHMIPSATVMLPKLPLTANGKIDRERLPAPEEAASRSKAHVPPRTDTEVAVAGIWKEVFRRDRVGVDDNFFEIGGHSLMATQVISRVREHFRVELVMRVLFEKPTIEGLAQAIETARATAGKSAEPDIIPVSREAYRARR